MNYSLAHLVIMAMTIGVVLAGGLYAARSVKSAEGFSLGGRSAGIPMIAGSIAGTCVGGGATVGTAQLAGSIGLSAVWFTIGVGLSLLIMGIIYARPLRYTGLETISQYLVENYGKGAGRFTSFATSLGILFSAVASTLPGIGLLAALTGLSYAVSASILLLLVILYAFFGGMKTASVGGILKMLILFVTLFALGIVAWQGLMEAPEILVNKPAGFLSIWGISTGSILNNLASIIVGMICTQTYIQAIFSAATPRGDIFSSNTTNCCYWPYIGGYGGYSCWLAVCSYGDLYANITSGNSGYACITCLFAAIYVSAYGRCSTGRDCAGDNRFYCWLILGRRNDGGKRYVGATSKNTIRTRKINLDALICCSCDNNRNADCHNS